MYSRLETLEAISETFHFHFVGFPVVKDDGLHFVGVVFDVRVDVLADLLRFAAPEKSATKEEKAVVGKHESNDHKIEEAYR